MLAVKRPGMGLDIVPASDHSILVTLGQEISAEVHARVRKFCHLLTKDLHEAVLNVHPAYASVLVTFEPRAAELEEIGAHLASLAGRVDEIEEPPARTVRIPVCYGGEFGPDLEEVSRICNLPAEEVVARHVGGAYSVYFLGFAPGFAYLGNVDEEIAAPRRGEPRETVPPGSVGINGRQTGIYPLATPGSWRLIGRTPVKIFDPQRENPSLLAFGDRVQFFAITEKEFRSQCR